MSRHSQDFFKHRIDNENTNSVSGVRFSLTFRSVDWRNRNSTCIIGDSNTGKLRFGTAPGSFGPATPGKRVWASNIGKIDPTCYSSYSNIVLMCGTNDIRHNSVNSPEQIHSIFREFKSKVEQIQRVNKRASVFVCPILPTKLYGVNRKASLFNSLISNDLLHCNYGVTAIPDFDGFMDETGFLSEELSRSGDTLHLNYVGVRKLAKLIKDCIFCTKKSRTKRNTVKHDMSFASAVNQDNSSAANDRDHRDGYQPPR